MKALQKKYDVNRLVYYEVHPDLKSAVKREKQLKNWHRQWKIKLIETMNKEWRDLYPDIADPVKLLYSNEIEMLKQACLPSGRFCIKNNRSQQCTKKN